MSEHSHYPSILANHVTRAVTDPDALVRRAARPAVACAMIVSESQNPLETRIAFAMDLFDYLSDYKVLLCRPRKYAVPPIWLQSHLQRGHKEDHDDLRGKSGPANVAKKLLWRTDMPLLGPRWDPIALPAPDSDPMPSLEVQTSNNKCLECFKILTDTKGIVKHLGEGHSIVRRGPEHPPASFSATTSVLGNFLTLVSGSRAGTTTSFI